MNSIWKTLSTDEEDNNSTIKNIDEFENDNKEQVNNQIYKPTIIIPYLDSNKKSNMKISLKKKGRKLKNELIIIKPNERIHSRLNCDNIKRKIKTHFHSFIINILNTTIKKEYGFQKYKFKKINSEITQNITINYNKNLLSIPIKEILKKVSFKFHDRFQNEKIINKIPNSKIELNKLLNITYEEMYEKYYLKSTRDLFKDEKENNSFESHLVKIQNQFGKEYMKKYLENAVNLIDFFKANKKRKKKIEEYFLKLNESLTNNKLNTKFIIVKKEQ